MLAAAVESWRLWSSKSPDTTSAADQPAPPPDPPKPTPGVPWFEDVTRASGIDFHHFDPATPRHFIQETMGSGLAWIDYNNDGWPDLFCVQDGPVRPTGSSLPTNKLYRNNGDGTFTDVTEQVGLSRSGYGMGCAVGDYDNDGYDDLVVTYLGGIVLYHNEPDGKGGRRFVDVTAKAGLTDPHWATSCAWGDIDGDGFLDLYVCNYCEVDLDHYPFCGDRQKGLHSSCPPTAFPHTTHRLFRNNGNGTFTDITTRSGIGAVSPAPGLAVIMADLDGDGRIDIYAANDLKPAYLFHNLGGGRFEEVGMLSGSAVGPGAVLIAGMGVEAGDINGTGRPALFVTNFQHKPNVLFLNKGNLVFQEWSNPSGLGAPSLQRLGFGTVFIDADLDGNLDIAVANGHIDRTAPILVGDSFGQQAQFFQGKGDGRFNDVSDQAGAYFRQLLVGRGLAWADYDNDGRPDLAFSHNGGPIALLHNSTITSNNWIRLELVGDGKKSNRNAIGSRVDIEVGKRRLVRFVNGGGSYLSASDRRILTGLGAADGADRVTVQWPSGRKQEFRHLAGRRWWRLQEGRDRPEEIHPGPHGK
jgi:hypothetical protein